MPRAEKAQFGDTLLPAASIALSLQSRLPPGLIHSPSHLSVLSSCGPEQLSRTCRAK